MAHSIHVGTWSGNVIKLEFDYCVWLFINNEKYVLDDLLTKPDALALGKQVADELACKFFDCDRHCKKKKKAKKKK